MRQSYSSYLRSAEWSEVRDRARKSKVACRCIICGGEAAELHHLKYSNLGRERLDRDLCALCRGHHQEFHEWCVAANRPFSAVKAFIKVNYPRVKDLPDAVRRQGKKATHAGKVIDALVADGRLELDGQLIRRLTCYQGLNSKQAKLLGVRDVSELNGLVVGWRTALDVLSAGGQSVSHIRRKWESNGYPC